MDLERERHIMNAVSICVTAILNLWTNPCVLADFFFCASATVQSLLTQTYGRGAVHRKLLPVAACGAAQKGFGLCGERLLSTQKAYRGAALLKSPEMKGRGLCGAEPVSTQKAHGGGACL